MSRISLGIAVAITFALCLGGLECVPAVDLTFANKISVEEKISVASEWGTNNYIEYVAGSGALIISIPHGGDLEPVSIPDRTYGTTVTDSWTIDMGRFIREAISEGQTPHLIVCHLARTKLDANRDKVEGAQGNPQAELAWDEFHAFITRAKNDVLRKYGKGLYIDLHGQSHIENWNEFGYLLTIAQLNSLSDRELNDPAVINKTSIRNLGLTSRYAFSDLIRGSVSMGGMTETAGYKSIPSPANPSPGRSNYFSGGFNTDLHGSRNGGTIDGIQLEMSAYVRRTTEAIRREFSAAYAQVLLRYLDVHYGL